MKTYLEEKDLLLFSMVRKSFTRRKNKESFSFNEYLKGLTYALLSIQRPWAGIASNLHAIEEIFLNFDKHRLLEADVQELEQKKLIYITMKLMELYGRIALKTLEMYVQQYPTAIDV